MRPLSVGAGIDALVLRHWKKTLVSHRSNFHWRIFFISELKVFSGAGDFFSLVVETVCGPIDESLLLGTRAKY